MMEMVQRSIGVQVNLCNCHCLLGQSISSLPPRSPRTTTRSRHHFIFNKALSVDNSHPSETSALRHKGVHDGSWESGQSANFHYSAITSGRGVGDYIGPGSGGPNCPCPYPHPHGSGQTVSSVNNSTSSRTARSSLSEMDSVSEADENNKLLECSPASTSSTMEQEDLSSDNNILLGDQDRSSEASRLLPSTNSASGSNSNLNLSEHNQNQMKSELSLHQTAADVLNKREQAHHFKRKYNFRSDSVFSDVMPLPAGADSPSRETPKNSDNRDKSGSLSSLKGQSSTSSKWASLRKKIGRLNSSSSEKKQHNALEQHAHLQHQLHQHEQQQHKQHHPKSAKVSLDEKRSLLQRAKTLSILPVNKAGKEEIVKKPKEVPKQAPTELFNVGGEMNMIPLELLIDINDLNIGQ